MSILPKTLTALAIASLSFQAQSQTTLPPITVTANPLGNAELASPTSSLAGDALVLRRASTLGETLKGLPGVSSSYFGPNASRPTIRGLDGERVTILSNAGASVDASTVSFDHAVPIDPLIVERFEVLRGPSSLLYGGASIGGVVNALDNRIPKSAAPGTSGSAELRWGGAPRELAGAALIESGNEKFRLHVDAFQRENSDQQVPLHTPVERGLPLPETRKVRNSSATAQGGAVGGSLFFDQGYVGLSADTLDNRYGTVAEADVRIKMQRKHLGLASEIKPKDSAVRSVRAQFNHTHYQHEEIDGDGLVGTTFKVSGNSLRTEAEHHRIGAFKGVLGTQLESTRFSALGDEAFVPSTHTRKQALFLLEEASWAGGTITLGARAERVQVESQGDADAQTLQFGPAQSRHFGLGSLALSNLFKPSLEWSLSAGLSMNERAPTSFELYANGLHAATGTLETGDASLGKERGVHMELGSTWKSKHSMLRASLFATHFSRFILLDDSGTTRPVTQANETQNIPLYNFKPVRAQLAGIEIEAQHRLITEPWILDASSKLDLTRSRNLENHQALPRIAPLRLTLGLEAKYGLWNAKAEVEHSASQTRVPANDTATGDFTMLNLALSRRFIWSEKNDALAFIKLTNLTNTLGYSATSIQNVRGLSPLPGRALKVGLRLGF
jgi:iron complex outermembrane recepter protein